jgi:putative NADH-flavin reductase
MKVLIFGATGPTGRELVTRALEKGHEVMAFARNPAGLGMKEEEGFHIFTGDVLQPATVDRAMVGQQAVLCAIGPRARTGIGETPTNVVSVATRHILEAMERCGTKRLISLSSVGVGDSRGKRQAGPFFGFFQESILIPLFLKRQFADKEVQEDYVQKSTVEWVLVRPTALTDRPARGQYRVATDGKAVPGRIARADVAAFMVDQLTSNQYLRKAPVIGG